MSLNPSGSPKKVWSLYSPHQQRLKKQNSLELLQAFLDTILSKGIKSGLPSESVAGSLRSLVLTLWSCRRHNSHAVGRHP